MVVIYTCRYCQQMQKLGFPTHDDEIRHKAEHFGCDHPKWHDFVESGLNYADHANLGPNEQIRLLTRIHRDSGCMCREG